VTPRVRRVVVAHPYPDRYGADRMLVAALRSLVDDGVDVAVRVPETGPLLETLREQQIPYDVAPFPVLRKALLRPWPLARLMVATPLAVSRLLRELRRQRPDVVYVNTLTLPHWLLAARLAGVPSVCHVREAEDQLARVLQRALVGPLRLATVVIANSGGTARWVGSNAPRVTGRTRVVYNGFDFAPVAPRRARAGTLRLLLVGRLNARKGPDVAIDAVAELAHAGCDVELEIVGDAFRGYEWYADELRQRAVDRGVADRVRFVGFAADPTPHYAAADIVLVPSRVEPFGNVAVEALAVGRPVVAARAGGLPEIVTDGETGLLCAAGSVKELTACVLRLAADPGLAGRLAEAGAASVRERFGMQQFRESFRAALEAAAGAESAP
jgi:glycosyltransferase involved in cell wall biosynthesis